MEALKKESCNLRHAFFSGFKLEHGVDRGQGGEQPHQPGHQLQLGDGGRSSAKVGKETKMGEKM